MITREETWPLASWFRRGTGGAGDLPSAAPVRGLHDALVWGARHTGLPVVVVAAIVLVITFRMAQQAARLAFQVAVVAALLAIATRMGWVTW